MNVNLDFQAEILSQKIKHYLITTMGCTASEANPLQFFQALSYSLREEIMINWSATQKSFETADVRTVYYLSMEYLPGRILSNNISNLHAQSLVETVLKKMNRPLHSLVQLEPDFGLGNGGLGRLASCFLESLATQNYPAMGYGLRYQYGIFEQQIKNGVQVEKPDLWLLNENPWEFRKDLDAKNVKFLGHLKEKINKNGETVHDLYDYEEVRALPFDIPIVGFCFERNFPVVTLRLWSTKESPHNFQLQRFNAGHIGSASENTGLTDVLYPNDNHETGKRIRLKQEFLLVSASLQDIFSRYFKNHGDLSQFADKVRIQLNDTHPICAIAELILLLTSTYELPWDQAVEKTIEVCGYTNHTILAEALEEWNQSRFATLLPRQYSVIEKLNFQFCTKIRLFYPHDEEKVRRMSIIENGQIRMANLAILGSHRVNGVAALHTDILKERFFRDFHEMFPEKFVNITNGVTQRHWLYHCNPKLSQFITERIGNGWITNFIEISKLQDFFEDEKSIEELMEIKKSNKRDLIYYLNHYFKNKFSHKPESIEQMGVLNVDENALFDMHIKRFHEYKRQLLNVLNLIMIYHEKLNNIYIVSISCSEKLLLQK